MWYLIVIYLVASFFLGWWPFDETDRAIENSDFDIYFYYPNGKEEYLGQVRRLSSCQSVAGSYAYNKGISSSDWSYICCRVTSDSSCASKHK